MFDVATGGGGTGIDLGDDDGPGIQAAVGIDLGADEDLRLGRKRSVKCVWKVS